MNLYQVYAILKDQILKIRESGEVRGIGEAIGMTEIEEFQ